MWFHNTSVLDVVTIGKEVIMPLCNIQVGHNMEYIRANFQLSETLKKAAHVTKGIENKFSKRRFKACFVWQN